MTKTINMGKDELLIRSEEIAKINRGISELYDKLTDNKTEVKKYILDEIKRLNDSVNSIYVNNEAIDKAKDMLGIMSVFVK